MNENKNEIMRNDCEMKRKKKIRIRNEIKNKYLRTDLIFST